MRALVLSLCSVLLMFVSPVRASQQSMSGAQVASLVASSLTALNGDKSVSDVTLTGTARRIVGTDDESGSVTLQANATGASCVNLSLTSGSFIEKVNSSTPVPAGTWSGPDSVPHPMAYQNLLTGPFWFFPAMALANSSSAPGAIATYIGHETHNGQQVEHIVIAQPATTSDPQGGAWYLHVSQLDFFLDSTTFLPAALDFNIHPDNNELMDIPVEIRFSGYASISGVQIPLHVQKLINNNLVLDVQVQNASLNSGLTVSQIIGQ
jgi:hypothetical protein